MASPNNGPTPPAGYKLDPINPPAGYVLDPDYSQVPAFLQQNVDMSKVSQVVTKPGPGEGLSVSKVSSSDPYKINVLDPGLYGPSTLNHELTHTFQDTRSPGITPSAPVMQSGRKPYDYGGVQGLRNARIAGKTVSDFNYEQQADMVKDYKAAHDRILAKAATGKATPADAKQMYDLQQAYHPFIKQLAAMPSEEQDPERHPLLELLGVQKTPTIDTKPSAPGLPSYDTPGLGMLPADPLMGGKSQPTKTKKK